MRKLVVALVGLLALVATAGSASAHPWWGRPHVYPRPYYGMTLATPYVAPPYVPPPVVVNPVPYGYASPYYYAPPVVRVYPRYHHWHRYHW
jgi:hypothetical protein